MLELFATVLILTVIFGGVINIIKVSKKSGGSKMDRSRMEDLEMENEELCSRVEVLEEIVTDDKYRLNKEFKDLAS